MAPRALAPRAARIFATWLIGDSRFATALGLDGGTSSEVIC